MKPEQKALIEVLLKMYPDPSRLLFDISTMIAAGVPAPNGSAAEAAPAGSELIERAFRDHGEQPPLSAINEARRINPHAKANSLRTTINVLYSRGTLTRRKNPSGKGFVYRLKHQ